MQDSTIEIRDTILKNVETVTAQIKELYDSSSMADATERDKIMGKIDEKERLRTTYENKLRTIDKDTDKDLPKEVLQTQNYTPTLNKDEKELLAVLKEVGIIGATTRLSATKFEPRECMEQAKKHLLFMGILGSKWVNSHSAEFETFLRRIDSKHGEVKFLLINPEGKAYSKLVELREGAIKEESLEKLHRLSKKFRCLRVKLYDDLPSFRIILIDESTLALSTYKLDRGGHFESKFGWENPHIVITSDAKWSLFDSFEHYYHSVWDSSKDLEDYISDKNKIEN